MELIIQELVSMLFEFLVFFGVGYLCWKHKPALAKALFAIQALAWGSGSFGLTLLSMANPNRTYQGLHDMLVMVLISAVGILVSSFFVSRTGSTSQEVCEVANYEGSPS